MVSRYNDPEIEAQAVIATPLVPRVQGAVPPITAPRGVAPQPTLPPRRTSQASGRVLAPGDRYAEDFDPLSFSRLPQGTRIKPGEEVSVTQGLLRNGTGLDFIVESTLLDRKNVINKALRGMPEDERYGILRRGGYTEEDARSWATALSEPEPKAPPKPGYVERLRGGTLGLPAYLGNVAKSFGQTVASSDTARLLTGRQARVTAQGPGAGVGALFGGLLAPEMPDIQDPNKGEGQKALDALSYLPPAIAIQTAESLALGVKNSGTIISTLKPVPTVAAKYAPKATPAAGQAAAGAAPTAGGTPVERLTQAIRENLRPMRGQIEQQTHEARQRVAGRLHGVFDKGPDGEAIVASISKAMKGKQSEVQGIGILLSQAERDALYTMVKTSPRLNPLEPATRANTVLALRDLFDNNVIPTNYQLANLEKVFGGEFAKAVLDARSLGTKIKAELADLINVPRLISTTFDASAPLRQGVIAIPGHPKASANAFGSMVQAMSSEGAAIGIEENLIQKMAVRLKISKEAAKLHLSPLFDVAPIAGELEEAYAVRPGLIRGAIERIPVLGQGIKASERGYVTYLNTLRANIVDETLKSWMEPSALEKALDRFLAPVGLGRGVGGWEALSQAQKDRAVRDLVLFANRITGRGTLGPLESQARNLSALFFSPRFFMSRIQAPFSLVASDPAVRRLAARDLALFVGTGVGVLALAKQAGAEVELNPTSPDFGKGRIGNTRFDFWGGYQPLVRYLAQAIEGKSQGVDREIEEPVSRKRVAAQAVRSKLSPPAGILWSLWDGRNAVGEPNTLEAQAYNSMVPFFIQDTVDAYKDMGVRGLPLAAATFFGVGLNSYQAVRSAQDEVAEARYNGRNYASLDREEKLAVDSSPEVQSVITRIERPVEALRDRVRDAQQRYVAYRDKVQADLGGFLEAANTGVAKRDLIRTYKEGLAKNAQMLFTEDIRGYLLQYKETGTLKDLYAEAYWASTPPLNADGTPNFDAAAEQKAQILAEAKAVGLDTGYITGTGAGTYRGGRRFQGDVAKREIEAYEEAQQAITEANWYTFWRTTDGFTSLKPETQALYEDYKSYQRSGLLEDFTGALLRKGQNPAQVLNRMQAIDSYVAEKQRVELQDNAALDYALAYYSGNIPHRIETQARLIKEAGENPLSVLLVNKATARMTSDQIAALQAGGVTTLEQVARLNAFEIAAMFNRYKSRTFDYRTNQYRMEPQVLGTTVMQWKLPEQAAEILKRIQAK